jgi:hypothetical protein
MLVVARELRVAFQELFKTRKYRLILISLVLIAAFISVSELAVAKLFTGIILNEGSMSDTKLAVLITGFFLFFAATRAGQYLQRVYRVNVFDKAFKASKLKRKGQRAYWRFPLAFELTNLLSTSMQLFVIISFFTYLHWGFGLLNFLVVLLIFEIYGRLFKNQIDAQRGFVTAKREKTPVRNSVKIGTRIKSGETGILISGSAMLLLLGVLLYLSYSGDLSASNTVVLFFGLRMQNSNLSSMSTGLMRFARALTHSE